MNKLLELALIPLALVLIVWLNYQESEAEEEDV